MTTTSCRLLASLREAILISVQPRGAPAVILYSAQGARTTRAGRSPAGRRPSSPGGRAITVRSAATMYLPDAIVVTLAG